MQSSNNIIVPPNNKSTSEKIFSVLLSFFLEDLAYLKNIRFFLKKPKFFSIGHFLGSEKTYRENYEKE